MIAQRHSPRKSGLNGRCRARERPLVGGDHCRPGLLRQALSAAVVLAVTAQPGLALSGLDLERFCNAPQKTTERITCDAYLRGLTDGIYLADSMSAGDARWCPPNN